MSIPGHIGENGPDSQTEDLHPAPADLRQERDFLALRLAEVEELLRDALGDQVAQKTFTSDLKNHIQALFALVESSAAEAPETRTERVDVPRAITDPREQMEIRLGRTALRHLESPLRWLMLPVALTRRYRKLRRRCEAAPAKASKPRRTSKASEAPARPLRLGGEGLVLRLHQDFIPVVVSGESTARDVWARPFTRRYPATLRLRMKARLERAGPELLELAGQPADSKGDAGNRKLDLAAGEAVRLFRLPPSSGRVRLRLRTDSKLPWLLQLEVRPAGVAPGPDSPVGAVTPRSGRIMIQAYDLMRRGRTEDALAFAEAHASEAERPAIPLLRANRDLTDEAKWLAHVNEYVRPFDIEPIELKPEGPTRFHRLTAAVPRRIETGPLVSVILCAFNAEATLEHAAQSILNQTWRPLELIIVDDASTDATPSVAEALARRDDRVKIHRNPVNLGCDVAKNPALDLATGQYITCQDADDWAHPERIERQINVLRSAPADIKVAHACFVRVNRHGEFTRFYSSLDRVSYDGALRPMAPTSLIERTFFREKLGHWDSVRFAADAELFLRTVSVFPDNTAIYPILACFALDSETAATHDPIRGGYSRSPLSKRYYQSCRNWHATLSPDTARMPFPHPRESRLFYAPAAFTVPDYVIRQAMKTASGPADPGKPSCRSDEPAKKVISGLKGARSGANETNDPARRRRTIWMYWTDPPDGKPRPPYLDVCIDSVRYRSGCDVRLCNEVEARELIPSLPDEFDHLTPSHQSDMFRVGILAEYGGMYIDCDTFVVKSLVPLFNLLNVYELIGADWRPRRKRLGGGDPLGIGVLGPVRPNLACMRAAWRMQVEAVRKRSAALKRGENYPIGWLDMICMLVPCFEQFRPVSKIANGAATWFALTGSPDWSGGDLGHPLRSLNEIGGQLPDSELFTLSNNLLPEGIRDAPVETLIRQDTILAHLLKETLHWQSLLTAGRTRDRACDPDISPTSSS